MKTLSVTSAIIAATFLTFGFNASAQNNDIIYSNLKPSDKPIIADLVSHRLPKEEGTKCPDTNFCQYVLSAWANGLSQEVEGRKYLQALESKPPHMADSSTKRNKDEPGDGWLRMPRHHGRSNRQVQVARCTSTSAEKNDTKSTVS